MKNIRKKSAECLKQAEAIVQKEIPPSENLTTLSPEEIQKTVHSLRVHQVELTLQNDELRRIQGELEATKQRYFNLYDLAPVGYMTISEVGLILEANLTAATMLGQPRQKLINKHFVQFISSEHQDAYYLLRKKTMCQENLEFVNCS